MNGDSSVFLRVICPLPRMDYLSSIGVVWGSTVNASLRQLVMRAIASSRRLAGRQFSIGSFSMGSSQLLTSRINDAVDEVVPCRAVLLIEQFSNPVGRSAVHLPCCVKR